MHSVTTAVHQDYTTTPGFGAPARPDNRMPGCSRRRPAPGYGVHRCLGQNLARVELQIAIPALRDLRLAIDPEELEIRPRLLGVRELPVAW